MWAKPKAHKAPVNVVRAFAGHMLATGDDNGHVKLWDARVPGAEAAAVTFSDHEDVITDMCVDVGRATLLTASGDGRLGVLDLRKPKLAGLTEQQDDELLSLAVIKGGATVLAGSQDGVLLSYTWGKWAFKEGDDATYGPDKFRGHPQSIDALLAVDADTVVTGSSDGIIRLVTVAPNKLVGVLGEHSEDPIERLAWDRARRLLASASHDNTVKFWDVGYLFDEDDGDDDNEGEGGVATAVGGSSSSGSGVRRKGGAARGTASRFTSLPALALPAAGGGARGDDDDEDDDEDEEDDDEEDDEEDEEGSDDEDSDDADMGRGRGGGAGVTPAASDAGVLRGPRPPPPAAALGGRAASARGGRGKGSAKRGAKAAFFDDL